MRPQAQSILACVLLLCCSGCAIVGGAEPLTPEQFKAEVVIDVSDAVDGVIALSDDPVKQAERVKMTATRIRLAAINGVDVTTIRQMVTDLTIRLLDEKDQPKARFVVNLLFRRLKHHFRIDIDLIPNDTFPVTRALVIECCDAAIQVADRYLR